MLGPACLETTQTKIDVRQLFSEIAPSYDRLNHLLSFNVDRLWRTKAIQALDHAESSANIQALDLCAGTLDLSVSFLQRFPLSRVWALDFALPMLTAGWQKISPSLRQQLTLIQGDALCLPFPDESFSIIFCGYGFRNLSDKSKSLAEIFRCLKPGGQILILDFFRPTRLWSKLFYKTYGAHVLPRIGQWVSGHRQAYAYLQNSIQTFYSLDECASALEQAGLKVVKQHDFCSGISSFILATKNL